MGNEGGGAYNAPPHVLWLGKIAQELKFYQNAKNSVVLRAFLIKICYYLNYVEA